MRLLSLLHRWVGSVAGLLLAVLGATGTLLVWRDALTFVPHARDAMVRDPALLARVVGSVAGRHPTRITFAGDGLGVHQLAFADGSGAYLSQSGETVAHWSAAWQRPELWLFDLHHRLLLGDVGEAATGVAGLVGLLFVVSGVVLWWRTRARFRLRAWPAAMTPGGIVHHHRDLGVVAAPLLAVSLATGVLMVFPALAGSWLAEARSRPPTVTAAGVAARDYAPLFVAASALFPDAEPRRLQWPAKPGAPVALRLRQPSEWTPNGRTFVYADPVTLRVVGHRGPAAGMRDTLYPIHAARVGGPAWRVAMTLSGVTLTLLGTLAVYGFWRTRWNVRAARRRRRTVSSSTCRQIDIASAAGNERK